MQTLIQATRTRGQAGASLPVVFRPLEAAGVRVRRGQITLVAAAPGKGKSVFALTLALRADVPTLYVSADSDSFTQTTRAAAMLTGDPMERVVLTFEGGNGAAAYGEILHNDRLRFDFSTSVTTDDISEEMECFALAYGQWPELLILDNLSNVWQGDASDGYVGLERTLDYLHDLGRQTGAAVLVLHHLTGGYDDGNIPAPLSALRGKVSKVPECVLTIYEDSEIPGYPQMGIAVVKNRGGKADPAGGHRVLLPYFPDRMQLGEIT